MKKKKDNIEGFNIRVKKAMDMMMYQSVSKNMAIAACATSATDAIEMLKYINEKF